MCGTAQSLNLKGLRIMTLRKFIIPSAFVSSFACGLLANAAIADQPRMHDALRHLQDARAELRAASDDKGGHRRAAIANVDAAIRQVNAGIRFDRRH
jgi:hypothetical protein